MTCGPGVTRRKAFGADRNGEGEVRRLPPGHPQPQFPCGDRAHDMLRQASLELVRALLPTTKGIRLLGVTVSNFDRAGQRRR